MPDTPVTHTEDLAGTVYDAGRRAGADTPGPLPPRGARASDPHDGETIEPQPASSDEAEVGLTQKGTGEDAIVRRETAI